jgi:hypothetical protein
MSHLLFDGCKKQEFVAIELLVPAELFHPFTKKELPVNNHAFHLSAESMVVALGETLKEKLLILPIRILCH